MPNARAHNWPAATSNLRDTLARSGVSEAIVERLLAAIAPAIAAIERDHGAVDDGLLWVLITAQADIYRRASAPRHAVERPRLQLPAARDA